MNDLGIILWVLNYLFFSLVGLLLIFSFTWRLASRRYNIPCPAWLGWFVELDNPFYKNNRARVIVQQLELKEGMKVVDLGCGPGRLTIPIAQAVGEKGEVWAVDIQANMLSKVQKKAQEGGLHNIHFLKTGAGMGQLKPEYFDRVLLVSVLGEIPNQEAALQEIYAALKPGGIFSVTEIIADPHFQTRERVGKLAGKVGLIEKSVFGTFFDFSIHFEKPV